MIPIRIRHKSSRRTLGFTAFNLKDTMAGEAVANWIASTLQCQDIPLTAVEVRIGSGPWKQVNRKENTTDVKHA